MIPRRFISSLSKKYEHLLNTKKYILKKRLNTYDIKAWRSQGKEIQKQDEELITDEYRKKKVLINDGQVNPGERKDRLDLLTITGNIVLACTWSKVKCTYTNYNTGVHR